MTGQWRAGLRRVGRIDVGIVTFGGPRLRIERQPVTHRRIAGEQVAALRAQEPRAGLPLLALVLDDRQHMANGVGQALGKHFHQALAFERIIKARVERIDISRQTPLAPQIVIGILESREDMFRIKRQLLGNALHEAFGMLAGHAVIALFVGIERRRTPDRLAVLAPETVEAPARQLFAGIPFTLAEVHQTVRRITLTQTMKQFRGVNPLGRAERSSIPFGAIRVVDRDEGWFTALGQTDIVFLQSLVDLVPETLDLTPLFVGVWLGDARRLPDTGDLHEMLEGRLALFDTAGHRRCRGRLWRASERNVAFAGEQAGSRVEADPAGARQINFGPRMEIGEIGLRP